ncbi:MAG: ABC-type nickel/cobalt efflux system permease component RcnA [Oceanospirillaceae bacterium]
MEISVLLVGFMIGLRHALEADHVAAVASIVTQKQGTAAALRHGAVWGLGHTITLFIFGTAVLLADTLIPDHMASLLECAVGFMLLYLGLDVLWRMSRKGVHFHVHQHHGKRHLHAHQHHFEVAHADVSAHTHKHNNPFPVRTLMIGIMHGMAGSAALVVLTLNVAQNFWVGMGYMLLFGIGSIAGMALLSAAISLPFSLSSKRIERFVGYLQLGIGLGTSGLGGITVFNYFY